MDYYKAFQSLVKSEKIESKQAVFFKGRATTYGELLDEADRVAIALSSVCGVKKGDTVGIYLGNCPQFLSIVLGIAQIGAIAQPASMLLTEYELKPQFDQAKPKAVFVSPVFLPTLEKIGSPGLESKNIIVMGDQADKKHGSYVNLLRQAHGKLPAVSLNGNDVVLVLFTAGTTGTPKGVMLTHKNLLAVINGQAKRTAGVGELVSLCAVPLTHIFGLNTLTVSSLFRKWPVVMVEWFQPEEVAQLIETYRIGFTCGVPLMIQALVDLSDKYDMKSLRLIVCGAAPVPEELYKRVEKKLPCILIEGWGLTEGSGNATLTEIGVRKIGSCGKPYEGIECAVVNEDDKILPAGEAGELVQRGAATMKGYLGNLEATKEALKNGWLHTGDIARIDKDGYFYIVDRKKDMIIRGGFNIYPSEVEAALYTLPDVIEAAVFGVQDERKGETVASAVRLKPDSKISEQELITYCHSRLARYKVPKYIKIVKEPLSRTMTGKIQRRIIKEQFAHEFTK